MFLRKFQQPRIDRDHLAAPKNGRAEKEAALYNEAAKPGNAKRVKIVTGLFKA